MYTSTPSTCFKMAASRVNSSSRICRRYKFFFYFCILVLCFQFYIGYSFYSMNQRELSKVETWKKDVEDRLKILPTTANLTRGRVFQGDLPPLPDLRNPDQPALSPNPQKDGTRLGKGYQPKCNITATEALSAISRATTDQCKQDLADVSCLSAQLKLYPPKLPRFCKYKGNYTAGHYLGCFKDSHKNRDLDKFNKVFLKDNTPQKCIDFCTGGSYMYAGVQYRHECWCGDRFGTLGALPESACDNLCTGDITQKCGGYNAQNVYSTGLPAKQFQQSEFVSKSVYVNNLKPVRIVFVLTITGRAVRQVHRLIKTLYHKQHYFYIHVDSRQEYLYRELLKLENVFPNIRLARDRFSTIWGGASLLQAHLTFMKNLLAMTDWVWDYYLNLSESDYPIKRVELLTAFLTKNRGHNFLKSNGRETPKFIQKQGLDQNFFECDNHLWRVGPRELQTGIRYDGGSDWICLYRDLCEYSVTQSDDLVTGLKEMYKFTLLPVESFFHTLVQNSHFCDTWSDNNLHMTNWKRKLGCKCQHKKVVDWCGCSPNDIKPVDMDRLTYYKTKATYFARKFEAIVSNDVLNQIDAMLFGSLVEDMVSFSYYWQNEFHHLDKWTSKNDVQLPFFHSLVRQTAAIFKQAQDTCAFNNVKILESHVLHVADQFHRLLVMYNTTLPGTQGEVTLESEFSMKQYYRVIDPKGPTGRLQYMEVGTDFDPKELILRNYMWLMSVDSEVVLRYVWGPGPSVAVSVAWIDPAGVIAQYSAVTIPSEGYIDIQKPKLQTPLRPGLWIVKLMHGLKLIAETKFLVMPSATIDGKAVTKHDVVRTNNGPISSYTEKDFRGYENRLQIKNSSLLMSESVINGLKVDERLDTWIDKLVGQLWTHEDTCSTTLLGTQCPDLNLCEDSNWSSLFPDPKSDLSL